MKQSYWVASLVVLMMVGSSNLRAWGGDTMNIEFLQRQALQCDPEIVAMATQLDAKRGPHRPSVFSFLMNTVGISAFTTSFYPKDATVVKTLGTIGGVTFYAPVLWNFIQDTRKARETKRLIRQLEERTLQVKTQVWAEYFDMKQGSHLARQALVQRTNETVLKEVEMNMEMERAWTNSRLPSAPPVPE